MKRAWMLLAAVGAVGCGRLAYDAQPRTPDGSLGIDAGPVGTPSDAGRVDAGPLGALDAGALDAGALDAGALDGGVAEGGPVDGGSTDTGADAALPGPCQPTTNPALVAEWTFDGTPMSLRDEVGSHHAFVVGDSSSITSVAGPTGCSQALRVGAGATLTWVEIAHSTAWDLDVGSLELWLRAEPGTGGGVISRDALNRALPGHFTMFLESTGTLWIRVQPSTGSDVFRCSDVVVTTGGWHHVGVRFGAPGVELWIDGVLQERVGTMASEWPWVTVECGSGTSPLGISGNQNPWTIGAAQWAADEGASTPATSPLVGGEIDHVRIWSARLDFSR